MISVTTAQSSPNSERHANPEPTGSAEFILGIKLDGHDSDLVKAASSIVSLAGAKMKLVHVVQAQSCRGMLKSSCDYLDQDIGKARLKIEALKEQCDLRDQPESIILRAEGIAEVLGSRDLFPTETLLILGSRFRGYRWARKAASLVLTLIDKPRFPILVLHNDAKFPAVDRPLEVVVADDLTEGFQEILSKAAAILFRFPRISITHVHVAERDVSGYVSPLTPLDDERPLSNAECSRLWQGRCEQIRQELGIRWEKAIASLDLRPGYLNYQAAVLTDQPMHGLLKAERDIDGDLMVVGRGTRRNDRTVFHERVGVKKLIDKCPALLVLGL